MCPTTPCKFLTLSVSHWDCLGRFDKAIPDLLEEPQPISNAERLDLLANGAHGRILHFSFRVRKSHVSTDRQYDFHEVRLTFDALRGLALAGQSRPVLAAQHD